MKATMATRLVRKTAAEISDYYSQDVKMDGYDNFYDHIEHANSIIHVCDMLLGKYGTGSGITLEKEDLKLFEEWDKEKRGWE